MMPTKAELANLALYRDLMEEAKARIISINTLTNDQRGLPSPLVREYCFLQLRMLCELIALACMVAHGDIVAKSPASLRKAYAPAEILRRLEDLHADFFPLPVIPERTEVGWHLGDFDRPFLTKAELLTLWNKCGDVLHRGSLKKLIGPKSPIQLAFNDVNEWGQKISNLLSVHRTITVGGRQAWVTFLQTDQLGGAVHVVIGEAPAG